MWSASCGLHHAVWSASVVKLVDCIALCALLSMESTHAVHLALVSAGSCIMLQCKEPYVHLPIRELALPCRPVQQVQQAHPMVLAAMLQPVRV